MKRFVSTLFVLLSASLQAQCPDMLLVSGYFSGNVHRYDACNGAFEGVLDAEGRLGGAQTSRIGPDGRLYVVAELRNRIERYDASTLAHVDTAVQLPAGFNATGMVFRGSEIWVASYALSLGRRFDAGTGQPLGDVFATGAGGLRGADNGMTFGPDGKLYVPGYDSHSVVRHDPATGTTSAFIAARAGGLFNARGILFEPSGETVLVSSEGNGKILRYAASDGRFLAEVASGLQSPTGMAFDRDGTLLVANTAGVTRVDASNGAVLGVLASASAGSIGGPTYVTVLARGDTTPVDTAQIGSQYWIAGAGPMTGKVIEIQDMASSVGAAFGQDFDPAGVIRKRWGSARITFTSCTAGQFSWDSTGAASAGFGQGSYPLQRLLPSAATRRCEEAGFDAIDDRDWVAGSWYGGPARDGEGLMLDLNADGIAFLTWFTYRPL
jgi:sugar lactone lactonase YvrE